MTLRFDQPWWFLGLLLCLPMAWVAFRWFVAMSAVRRWSAIILRCVLVAALLGMLAGSSMVRRTDRIAVIACVDLSGSVRRFYDARTLGLDANGAPLTLPAAVRRFLDASSKSRRPDDIAGVVLFGARPAATGMVEPGPFRIPDDWTVREDATDIGQAIRLAAAMIPPDAAGRIIVFSDGVQTQGSALAAAAALSGPNSGTTARRSIHIDVVPLEYRVDREVVVESVDSPPTAQSGATIAVRVVLNATERCTGTLELAREKQPVDINGDLPGSALRLTLDPGRNVEVFKVPLPDGRIHRFAALWTPDPPAAGEPSGDTVPDNNRAESVTIAPGRGAVLIVDGISDGAPQAPGSTLGATLAKAGLEVQTIGPDALLPDLLWLQQFDLIILQNVSADATPRTVHTALATCVTQLGVGLVMVGGPNSFGAGGWKGTDIEPLLPVKLDLPEKLITPAAAVILVIDNSGSMNRTVRGSTRSQQDIADEGAALAVESMDKTDLVGVITFNSDMTVDLPLGPNRDPKATARMLRRIDADGGTNMPPALAEAHHQIRSAKADLKHVIVLSDGVSQGKNELPGMVEQMAADGIIVSTIAIGNDADSGMMRDMARLGKGQFYRVVDPTILPRVLLKAVRIVRSPLIREGEFTPIVLPTGSPIMDGLSAAFGVAEGGILPLRGVVLTQARTDPTVIYPLITPKRSEGEGGGGEPVLGYWNAGLGRVAAFTSDAQPKWAGPWLDANGGAGYSRFWTQLARTIARPPSDRTQELTTEIDGDRMTIRLHASEQSGRPIDALAIPGAVYAPGGGKLDVRLSQIGPGEYEQVIDLGSPTLSQGTDPDAPVDGSYVVTLAPRRTGSGGVGAGGNPLPPVIGGITRPAGEEYRRLSSDRALLKSIADATGGQVWELKSAAAGNPSTALPDLYSRTGLLPAEARTPLWPLLAIASVALMLLDVATRRIAWDRLLSREMLTEASRGVSATLHDRTAQATATLTRLRTPPAPSAASPPSPPSHPTSDIQHPTFLTDEDAAALNDRERNRRRDARMAALRTKTPPPPTPTPPTPQPPDPQQPPIPPDPTSTSLNPDPDPPEQGLKAAKRRAQRKMDE